MPSLNPASLGVRFSDPRQFPKAICIGNSTTQGLQCAPGNFPGESDFWTELANRGVAVDSNNTGGSYKQIVSLSGRGILYGAMSMAIANSADTVTWEFTRDGGTAVEVAFAPGTVNYRFFLGYWAHYNMFNADYAFGNSNGALDATKTVHDLATGNSPIIVSGQHLDFLSGKGLAFQSSLLVRLKATTSQTGTANQERQAGVFYRMEG
jgi:hypothetical protein